MDLKALNFKYAATVKGILYFYAALLLTIVLLAGKLNPGYMIPWAFLNENQFYSHVSNFIISYNLLAIVSFIWLMQGAPFWSIIVAGIILVGINFVIELFVRILNTPDIIDAFYGVGGVITAILVMFLVKKTGLRAIDS